MDRAWTEFLNVGMVGAKDFPQLGRSVYPEIENADVEM